MKIYILRHEERTIDASFFGPLTKNGILNSINLIPILEKENINKIYCSPFIRTLQTILPYSKKKNIKLNLEYGLVEIQHPDIIAPKSVRVELPDYLEDEFNKNKNYTSIIKTLDLQYPEDDKLLERRTKTILKNIIETNYKTNDNILLVTHQGLCKTILKIVNNSFVVNTEYINEYKTGTICLIFDTNKWIYKKIN